MASEAASTAEAKQQGIIETAQAAGNDPSSTIQPELVEKKLVEESQKAGAPAFQLDPDASPQEKSNAAKSVSGCATLLQLYVWLTHLILCTVIAPLISST